MSAHYFPAPGSPADYCNDPVLYDQVIAEADRFMGPAGCTSSALFEKLDATGRVPKAGDVKYIYTTKAGPGPLCQPVSESLLDSVTGQPVEPGPKHKRMKIQH